MSCKTNTAAVLGDSKDEYILVKKPVAVSSGAAAAGGGNTASTTAPKVTYEDLKTALPRGLRFRVGQQSGRNGGLISIKMVSSFSYQPSAGVLTPVISIDPSANTTEWAAIQILYDQYRVRAVSSRFWLGNSVDLSGTNLGFVLAYDPTDSTALAGVREGCEFGDHMLLMPSIAGGSAGYGNSLSKPFVYSPQMIGGKRAPSASVPTRDEWSTTASPVAYGYIKAYAASLGTNTPGYQGILSFLVEFRSRT